MNSIGHLAPTPDVMASFKFVGDLAALDLHLSAEARMHYDAGNYVMAVFTIRLHAGLIKPHSAITAQALERVANTIVKRHRLDTSNHPRDRFAERRGQPQPNPTPYEAMLTLTTAMARRLSPADRARLIETMIDGMDEDAEPEDDEGEDDADARPVL